MWMNIMSKPPRVEEFPVDNRFACKNLPIELNSANYVDAFRTKLLSVVRPNWNPDKLGHTVFTGGISNFLAGIYEEGRKDMVMIRIDGQGTEIFINRTTETIVMVALNQAGLIPPLYCRLKNGLCYGFAKGRHFEVEEMQDRAMMRRTTRALAKLHAVEIPAPLRDQKPQVWAKCDEWLGLLPKEYTDPKKNECFRRTIGSLSVLSQELERLKTETSCCQSPVVFCHNDMLHRNLIYNSEEGTVTLIDFEYGGPNFLAFDIGNHFCEFAGIDNPDYNLYPNESLQKLWIRMYLQEAAQIRGEDPSEVTDAAVHTLYREANKFALLWSQECSVYTQWSIRLSSVRLCFFGLLSLETFFLFVVSCFCKKAAHMFWCLWGLLQGCHSLIDFDYVEYAGIRFAEFQRRKEEFYAL